MEGWIKLHRKFSDWEWFNISEMVHLFIFLLINANHEDGEWRGIKIKRGQILTGLHSLNKSTKISIQTIRTCLKRLEKTQEINIQVTNKYSIITICKYDDYQQLQQTTNKQSNKQLTSNQQTTNNKQEGIEVDINISTWRSSFDVYLHECKTAYTRLGMDANFISEQSRLNPGINVGLSIEKGFINFWGTELGWKHKKKSHSKVIDWDSTIINSIGMNKVYYTKQEMISL
jgi:hypothetical protein